MKITLLLLNMYSLILIINIRKNDLLKLSDREWVCPHCGAIIDRDYNAALNLRDYFYKVIYNTVGTTEIKACGETPSTLRETLTQAVSMKQEAPSFRWE